MPFLLSSYDYWSKLPKIVVKHCGENKEYLLLEVWILFFSCFYQSWHQRCKDRGVKSFFLFFSHDGGSSTAWIYTSRNKTVVSCGVTLPSVFSRHGSNRCLDHKSLLTRIFATHDSDCWHVLCDMWSCMTVFFFFLLFMNPCATLLTSGLKFILRHFYCFDRWADISVKFLV